MAQGYKLVQLGSMAPTVLFDYTLKLHQLCRGCMVPGEPVT